MATVLKQKGFYLFTDRIYCKTAALSFKIILFLMLITLLFHVADFQKRQQSILFYRPKLFNQRSDDENLPQIFLYRRTKKTGSSSMLAELVRALPPYNYIAVHAGTHEMIWRTRFEMLKPNPKNILILEHNKFTRSYFPGTHVVIADTIRDGFHQMTSFCRHVQRVRSCGEEMEECLQSEESRRQVYYRWGGKEEEDPDTYIDLPLSSAHPALSTAIMRKVFPGIEIFASNYNAKNTSCPETTNLRKLYDKLYSALDEQIVMLKERMVKVAGYPLEVYKRANMSADAMLSFLEAQESQKWSHNIDRLRASGPDANVSKVHQSLLKPKHWIRVNQSTITLGFAIT